MGRVFLTGIGFRAPGLRLAEPVTVKGERALTVRELVAVADGTDLVYEVEWHAGENLGVERDKVILRPIDETPVCRPGSMSVSVRAGKLVCTRTLPPIAAGTRHVDLHVNGNAGDWSIPLDLEPFGNDGQPQREVGTSDTRHGVTIVARGLSLTDEALIVELAVATDRPRARVEIGGFGGLRDDTTAMRLVDTQGRTYGERTRNDARDQLPGPPGADVGVFDRPPLDAAALTLKVPYVFAMDGDARADVPLPVTSPVDVEFGPFQIRLVDARPAQLPEPRGGGPALALTFDYGDWQNDRRLIMPAHGTLDGKPTGFVHSGFYAPAPPSVTSFLIPATAPGEARTLGLTEAWFQVRGPWRLPLGAQPTA